MNCQTSRAPLSLHSRSDPTVAITPAINGSAFPRTMLVQSNGSRFSLSLSLSFKSWNKRKLFPNVLKHILAKILCVFFVTTTLLWFVFNFCFQNLRSCSVAHCDLFPQFVPFSVVVNLQNQVVFCADEVLVLRSIS